MRSSLLKLALAIALVISPVLYSACGGGSSSSSSSGESDSSSGGDSSSSSGGSDDVSPTENSSDSQSGSNGTSHNAGRDCLSSNCHGGSSMEADKRYTYAGTVYSDVAGTTAATGKLIVITEASGTKINITSDRNGNFYTRQGTPSAGYSATIQGNTTAMISQPATGACSSCHITGGVTLPIYTN